MSNGIGKRYELIDVDSDDDDVNDSNITSDRRPSVTSDRALVVDVTRQTSTINNRSSSSSSGSGNTNVASTTAIATVQPSNTARTNTATTTDSKTMTKPNSLPQPTTPPKEKNIFLLPNGQIMDAKNTLQSFVVATAVVASASASNPKDGVTATAAVAKKPNHTIIPARATSTPHVTTDVAVSSSALPLHHPLPIEDADMVEPLSLWNVPALPVLQDRVPPSSRCTKRCVYVSIVGIVVVVIAVLATAVLCGTGNCPPPKQIPLSTTPTTSPHRTTTTPTPPTPLNSKPFGNNRTPTPTLHISQPPSVAPTATTTISTVPSVIPTIISPPPQQQQLSKQEVMTMYSNRITLTGKNISFDGPSPEDAALRWMVQNDPIFNTTNAWSSLQLTTTSADSVVEQLRFQQRFALLTLWYQQIDTDGVFQASWLNDHGWLSDIDECRWFGILCTGKNFDVIGLQSVVTEIDFYNDTFANGNNVTGRLPADVGLLSFLQSVNFRKNGLFATLPSTIGQWMALTYFDINSNNLSGTMPVTIGLWSVLTHFDVSDNTLTGTLPSTIGQWTALTHFDISINALYGTIPSTIGNWSAIEMAFMNRNQFTGTMPSEICNFSPKLWIDCVVSSECFTQCD